MTTLLNSDNIQPSTLEQLQNVRISNIQVTNSSYVVLDDTAVSLSGGYIKITGSNFNVGVQGYVGSTLATSITRVNSTEINAQIGAGTAGSYIVYVVNTNGSTGIRVNGVTYSGSPTWVTSSTLPSGLVNIPISIQLSATGDTPLVYTLQTGSVLPTGLTLTSGGLLSGTVSGLTAETTYNFTIEVTDPELQESPRSFTITITASDTYFDYVNLLFSANANITPFVTDASTNNFTITINGDTRPSNFNPYELGYYSNYFDGTGDFLSFPTNNLLLGSNNFTMEAWVYLTASPSTAAGIFYGQGDGASPSGSSYGFLIASATTSDLYIGSSTYGVTSPTPQLNKWVHVAWVRTSGTFSSYLNGSRVGTRSDLSTLSVNTGSTSNTPKIGAVNNGSVYNITGYISNARIIVGSGGYDATQTTITVPTAPLTAIANTSLLTCQSSRFIDNSTNNFTVTVNGNTTINSVNPFIVSSSYATYGSGYFDGTGDSLSAGTNTAFSVGTGDFTLEAWVYPTNFTNYRMVFDNRNNVNNNTGFFLGLTGNQSGTPGQWYFGKGAGVNVVTSNTVLTLNRWHHIVSVRSSSTTTLYLNGVNVGSGSDTQNYSDNAALIGITIDNIGWLGYISNLRLVKGTAVYTSAFTPPTSPLTAISGTSLLTLQTNQPANTSAFLDNSNWNNLISRTGNVSQGSFSPYGYNWSYYFGGSGNYLTVPNTNSVFNFGTGNFTVEAWVFMDVLPSGNGYPASYWIVGGGPVNSNTGFDIAIGSTNLQVGLASFASLNINFAHGMVIGTWYHIAVVRNSNTLSAYINGTLLTSSSVSGVTADPCATGLAISAAEPSGATSGNFNGYISNLRIVKGTAVYTANFTPSTSPLTVIANTSLLTCMDNRFVDDSQNRLALTRNGSVLVMRFSPFNPLTMSNFYSAYFDGTGDYLTTPSSNELIASGNGFTIESYVYYTSITNFSFIVASTTGANNYNPYWFIGSTSGGNWRVSWGDATAVDVGVAIVLNTWHHVAMSMGSNGAGVFYVNGVSIATTTGKTLNGSATGVAIAHGGGTLAGQYLVTGYISNVRYVKNNSVYTSNFTPPTQPLTAISGTSLLTCQSATFIDNSSNNFTITVNGNSIPTVFAPFTSTATTNVGYSPSIYGGSAYFDGVTEAVSVASSPGLSFGTRDFTMEIWHYPGAKISTYPCIFANYFNVAWAANYWGLYERHASNPTKYALWVHNASSSAALLVSNAVVIPGQWTHIAITRSGNTFTMYINGVLDVTASSAASLDTGINNALHLGQSETTTILEGFLSDCKITQGQVLYNGSFAPPVAPLTTQVNTGLLCNFTAAGIYDSAMMAPYETAGQAKIVTNLEYYGTNSVYFDGSGDGLFSPSMPIHSFGSGNFTIEFWYYPTSTAGTNPNIMCNSSGSISFASGLWSLHAPHSSYANKYSLWVASFSTSAALLVSTSNIATNAWTFVTITRTTNTWRLFINGTIEATATHSGVFDNAGSNPQFIGYQPNAESGRFITGYMCDIRFTKGYSRYTSNFSTPSSPFINN